MTSLQFLSQDSWVIKTCLFTMLLRVFSPLFSPFCLRLMFPSPFQHLENHLYFPWPLSPGPFFFFLPLSENSFSFLQCHLAFSINFLTEQVSVSIPLALASSPSVPVVLCYPFHLCLFFRFCPMYVWKSEVVCASGIPPTNTQTHILCWSLPTF